MTQTQDTPSPFVFQISDLYRLMKQSFAQDNEVEITRAQARVLISVWRNPGISQQALAARLEIATMSVCRLVDALEGKGLIERRTDENDRRVRRLFVTDKSDPITNQVLARVERISGELLAPLTADERKTFDSLLDRIISHSSSKRTGGDA